MVQWALSSTSTCVIPIKEVITLKLNTFIFLQVYCTISQNEYQVKDTIGCNDKAFFSKENIPNEELVGKEIPRQIDLLILVMTGKFLNI